MKSIESVAEAINIYLKKWQKVVVPYALLFFIGVLLSTFRVFFDLLKFLLFNVSKMSIILVLPLALGIGVVALVLVLLECGIQLSIYPLINSIYKKKRIVSWTDKILKGIWVNIKIVVFEIVIAIVLSIPFTFYIIANIPYFMSLVGQLETHDLSVFNLLLSPNIIFGLFLFLITALALAIIFWFLIFMKAEMMIKNRNLIDAAKISLSLSANNIFELLVYSVVLFLINITVFGVLVLTLFLAIILIPLVGALFLKPLNDFSLIFFWNKLKEN